ncbi:MAG: hypothetical protein ACRC6D_10050 [Aeromonas sp.]
MPKQLVAVELEAINRDGEIQVVRDSGMEVHAYSVYLRIADESGRALANWVMDSDTLDPARELAKRLSFVLAIPLIEQLPESSTRSTAN